jgi:acetyl esterase/lipase
MTGRRLLAAAAVVLVAAALTACDGEPTSCRGTAFTAHRDLRYASSPGTAARLQSLDLYTPVRPAGCGAAPVVVWVHGGAFVTGDKANGIAKKVSLFTTEGWGFASLNYRLVDDPGAGPTTGRYPAPEQDVAAAVAFLRRSAGTYGLDAGRMVFLGHSAGAFLASLDTTYDIPTQIAGGGGSEDMFRNAFGDDPEVWEEASPMRNVAPGRGIPDFLIVTRGTAARVSQASTFATRLRDADVPARLVLATGLTHDEVNGAVGAPGDTVVTPPLMDFFRDCVRR